ncbi:pentapeptide repeat-containing protein [Streptomyces sp. NPDC057837]|uniref:pentapeptide repeat-containing protein n=1 Tax=Streptomyces sp. NPDC057837 TaxID=3346260 RepID=UPI00368B815F
MTSAASPSSANTPPHWHHCAHGTNAEDPVGCRGVLVGDRTACLAHLDESARAAYLDALEPGADIDHRGTPFTSDLLDQLLNAVLDPTTDQPRVGRARFDSASFSTDASFERVSFSGDASFERASFLGRASFETASFPGTALFEEASFSGTAQFDQASFSGTSRFVGASFTGHASFEGVSFSGVADFSRVCFSSGAWFRETAFSSAAHFGKASFSDEARFDGATFSTSAWFVQASFADSTLFRGASISGAEFRDASFAGDAWFDRASFPDVVGFVGVCFSFDAHFEGAQFEAAKNVGPLVCGQRVILDGAVFGQPVTLEVAARQVSCARTQWASAATLQLRYAELDLRDAVLEWPALVAARPTPWTLPFPHAPLPEAPLSGDPGVRLSSLGGIDAAHLALHDIDLSECRFAGTVHLDQLKVDGWCTFARTPTGWHRHFPWRWSPRNTVAEEHHWRSRNAPHPDQATAQGWTPPPPDAPELRPAAVAALYRQLRKSLEDGRNEPDAADFYYGECEMRRHDTTRPRGERALLMAYWALSGYGLRATRALAWLGAAMAATIMVMVLWGLPADDPKPTTTGREVAVGQQVVLTTDTPDPVNPTGPLTERATTERFEKALRVVINSVVFRSSGQDLTTAGTYTEMTSRLAEPILLGLAVLAVRSRVKR